jgi:hypothetical protein
MAVTPVNLESESNKSRFVTLAQKNNAGTYVVAGADAPLITVDVNHQRNHDGLGYFVYKIYPEAAPLVAGASINIVLAFPSGTIAHMKSNAMCLGYSEFYLYENVVASGGTAFVPINRNRTSSNTSAGAVIINPTVTAVGTLLDAQIIPAEAGKKTSGGNAETLEFVLKPLTNYLFRLTNANGFDHAAYMQLEWYE